MFTIIYIILLLELVLRMYNDCESSLQVSNLYK